MTLRLRGSSSQYVDINASPNAGDATLTLPTDSGTVTVRDASGDTNVGTGVTIGNPSANILTINNTGGERLRITSTGNVGIGTNDPTDHLQILHTNGKGLTFKTTESHYAQITGDSNRSSSDSHLLAIEGHWNGTPVAEIALIAGSDTTNKDDGQIIFRTSSQNNLNSNERLRITGVGTVRVPDTGRFTCGTGDDLALRHDGTTGVLENNTGSFFIDQNLTDGDVYIRADDGSGSTATYFQASGGDGQARLFYYGAKKLNTHTSGVQVTGLLTINSTNSGLDYNNVADTLELKVEGGTIAECNISQFIPGGDNTIDLGGPGKRWEEVFSVVSAINTSDSSEKQSIEVLNEKEVKVAQKVKGLIRKFRFNSAVEKKGDDARIHVGIIAQDLKAAFESEGLVAEHYSMFCSDTWEEDGVSKTRLGVRYSELFAFMIAVL